MGLWEHRGKVAVVGWGQSHIDRRFDGVTLDRSCGGLTKEACLKAISDAGLSLDDIDGLITSAETRAEQTWAPRPYFDPPYDTEDGLTFASAEWIERGTGLEEHPIPEVGFALHRPHDGAGGASPWATVCARRPWSGIRWSTWPAVTGTTIRRTTARRLPGPPAFTLPWGLPERSHVQQPGDLPAVLQEIRQVSRRTGSSMPEPAPKRAVDSLELLRSARAVPN